MGKQGEAETGGKAGDKKDKKGKPQPWSKLTKKQKDQYRKAAQQILEQAEAEFAQMTGPQSQELSQNQEGQAQVSQRQADSEIREQARQARKQREAEKRAQAQQAEQNRRALVAKDQTRRARVAEMAVPDFRTYGEYSRKVRPFKSAMDKAAELAKAIQ